MKARYYLILLGTLPNLASAGGTPYFAPQQSTDTVSAAAQEQAEPAAIIAREAAAETVVSQTEIPTTSSVSTLDPAQVDCVAKVIIHEAGNQSRHGKIAVAQVVRARMNDPRFPATACGVIKQRGQFFNVDAYNPSRDTSLWGEAVEIATMTLSGGGEELMPGALFFHSRGARMPNRRRIGVIQDHIFYR